MLTLMRLGWGQENPAFRQVFTSQFIPGGTKSRWTGSTICSGSRSRRRTLSAISRELLHDVIALLPQVKIPTLVMHAQATRACPSSRAAGSRHPWRPLRPLEPQPPDARGRACFAAIAPGGRELPRLDARARCLKRPHLAITLVPPRRPAEREVRGLGREGAGASRLVVAVLVRLGRQAEPGARPRPRAGGGKLAPLCDAPGEYVKAKA